MSEVLTLCTLPSDMLDEISSFLDNESLFVFLTLSRNITVSNYLLKKRQKQKYSKKSIEYWSEIGDLKGVQYAINHNYTYSRELLTQALTCGARYGHLDVVKFLYSIGAPITDYAIDYASEKGHFDVVKFMQRQWISLDRSWKL